MRDGLVDDDGSWCEFVMSRKSLCYPQPEGMRLEQGLKVMFFDELWTPGHRESGTRSRFRDDCPNKAKYVDELMAGIVDRVRQKPEWFDDGGNS